MAERVPVKYSIIRYSPDEIRGEVINVGLIVHDCDSKDTKFSILDEHSIKLKSILETRNDINIYKSYKDVIEFYLSSAKDNLSGTVGSKTISSVYSNDFLKDIYEYYNGSKLHLSDPSFAMTKDIDKLFEKMYTRYIRRECDVKQITSVSAKECLKEKFEQTNLLGKKIKTDYRINPIKGLEDYKVRIDFSYKNGVWNYMQAMPTNSTKYAEWFSKIQIMSENINENEGKIHLIYNELDSQDETINNFIKYLETQNKNINILNINNEQKLNELCDYIGEVGEDIEIKIS